MRSKDNNAETKSAFKEGDRVWVLYDTSAQNDRARWVHARVEEATEYWLKCRRNRKGPPMTVAYEHVQMVPTGKLSSELCDNLPEDELYGDRGEYSRQLPEADARDLATRDTGNEDDVAKASYVPDAQPPQHRNGLRNGVMEEVVRHVDETEPILHTKNSLFSKAVLCKPNRDIEDADTDGPDNGEELKSSEQHVLKQVYDAIRKEQVTRKKMECAPRWILNTAVVTELSNNWADAYAAVKENSVPRDANIISSHFVYKVKKEENGKMRLKARLCPHGNRDKVKDDVRKDSATAQFDVIRLVCSMATVLEFRLGCPDIKGAYLQSGPIQRGILVRPPRECSTQRGMIWRLAKMPYGISEARRQWAEVFEGWLLEEANFERIYGVSQMFIQRSKNGTILMIMAKVTDDLLMASSLPKMQKFIMRISARFPISKAIVDGESKFNGSDIAQEADGTIRLSMASYLKEAYPVEITTERKKRRAARATDIETNTFPSLAGKFVWIGFSTVPQASHIGSWMQQRVPTLTVEDLLQANGMLKETKELSADIKFRRPPNNIEKVVVTSFSDAAFNIKQSAHYGQTSIICGIRFVSASEGYDVYHVVDWASTRQRRVCYSSYGTEILACTDADDRGLNIKMCLRSLFPGQNFTHELNVDSKGPFDTVITLHEGRDFRLRQTVQRIHDSVEAREMDVIQWLQGPVNIADALTKRSTPSQRILNHIAHEGLLKLPPHRTFPVDSERWS